MKTAINALKWVALGTVALVAGLCGFQFATTTLMLDDDDEE
jgi:hypothetical protein